jgi:predicted ATPase
MECEGLPSLSQNRLASGKSDTTVSMKDQYLIEVLLKRDSIRTFDEYPFCLDAVSGLHSIEFHPKVTYFVGENGTGKSTLLEAIAVAWGFNAEGGTKNFNFATRESHSNLWEHLRLSRGIRKPRDGFFLRAESFYNVATNIDDVGVADSYGGVSLHHQSHGESFMAVVMNRFSGNGLYILDEPEAALSPTRQMALLSRMHDLLAKGSQFVIATHSPIIMAYPDATIYRIEQGTLSRVPYTETEHFQITREFLNNHSQMLKILLEETE